MSSAGSIFDTEKARNLVDWMCDRSHIVPSLDGTVLEQACATLTTMALDHARSGHLGEYEAALIKMLAASQGPIALHRSEDEIFAATHRLREAIYFEVMQYRRAALRDIEAGVLDA